jgi:hypothetical protein
MINCHQQLLSMNLRHSILANMLQSCISATHSRDVVERGSVCAEGWGGVDLGVPTADIRRALLHRLSHLLALQRGTDAGNDAAFVVATSRLPRVQVGPERQCSPHHQIPFSSRHPHSAQGLQCGS